MKTKTTKAAMLLVMLILVKWGMAQDVSVDGSIVSFSSPFEKLQVKNGLLTHNVSGTVASFGTGSQ